MEESTKPKNILLIRSATNTFNATVKSLKSEFQNSKIAVLSPESTLEMSKKLLQCIDAIISLPEIRKSNEYI